MGIEPTRTWPKQLENKGFGGTPDPKCDGRVNFRITWGHVGKRKPTPVATDALGSVADIRTAGRSIRLLSIMLQPSVFATQDPWPSSGPISPAATGERSTCAPCPTSVVPEASAFLPQCRTENFRQYLARLAGASKCLFRPRRVLAIDLPRIRLALHIVSPGVCWHCAG